MEYESSKERLSTNPSLKTNGKRIAKEKKQKVAELLKDGMGATNVSEIAGVSKPTVLAIRNEIEDEGGFKLQTWKKNTANTLSQIVARGSTRLLSEIENIPAGQLPIAIAILTDKCLALAEQPTTIVEHRLRVSHADINSLIRGEIIDVTPKDSDLTK